MTMFLLGGGVSWDVGAAILSYVWIWDSNVSEVKAKIADAELTRLTFEFANFYSHKSGNTICDAFSVTRD